MPGYRPPQAPSRPSFGRGSSSQQSAKQPGPQGSDSAHWGRLPECKVGDRNRHMPPMHHMHPGGRGASMGPLLCQRQPPTNMLKRQGMGDPRVPHVPMMVGDQRVKHEVESTSSSCVINFGKVQAPSLGPHLAEGPAPSNLLNSPALRGRVRALG